MNTTPKNLLKLGRLTAAKLVTLALTVSDRLAGNATYPTPSPTLLVLDGLITATTDAITLRGTKQNKGSAADTIALEAAVSDLRQAVIQLAQYCMNTTPYDKDTLVTCGFAFKGKKHVSRTQQTARNLANKVSRTTNPWELKLAWKKPLGLSGQAIVNRMWTVKWNTVPNFNTSVVATKTSKAKVIINCTTLTGITPAPSDKSQIYFWIVGQNGKGISVISNLITARFTAT